MQAAVRDDDEVPVGGLALLAHRVRVRAALGLGLGLGFRARARARVRVINTRKRMSTGALARSLAARSEYAWIGVEGGGGLR